AELPARSKGDLGGEWSMRKRSGRAGAIGLVAVLQLGGAAVAAEALIEGTWLTATKSEMTIAPCAEGYCGYISKIVVPDHIRTRYGADLEAIGTNFTDYNNKDPALRGRPIQGLNILTLK